MLLERALSRPEEILLHNPYASQSGPWDSRETLVNRHWNNTGGGVWAGAAGSGFTSRLGGLVALQPEAPPLLGRKEDTHRGPGDDRRISWVAGDCVLLSCPLPALGLIRRGGAGRLGGLVALRPLTQV
ncbi:hypothetical protein NDU88_004210 [Pleurodeles waltl]|uniref:Uncharacterized protein n=1 Tax=Pleurodeles waltl TaxID=8319 RepID=A0AAV7WXI7_PLEWA|nr:hypothetical protein NDU88_004210 [Pleurodeles waltl]